MKKLDRSICDVIIWGIMNRGELRITAPMARLKLGEDEEERLREAVAQMLTYFTKMQELEIDSLEPTAHVLQRAKS